jgi:capsular exopolysaccharide synthesis family protein
MKETITMVAVNLAQALAEQGQVTLLIDCDLRNPDIGKEFEIDNGLGLSGLLNQTTSRLKEIFNEAAHQTDQSNLFVVSSGPESTSPTTLLASGSMDRLMDYLDAQGQMTVLGAPPVLGLADVSVLAPKVDGVILVVMQDHSTRDSLYNALKQMNATRARVLGLVYMQRSTKGWKYS